MAGGKRIDYIDIARAIGMVAIIIGHSTYAEMPYLIRICFTFHVPLFFILSGLFARKYPWRILIKKRFKSLIIPYIVTSLAIIGLVFIIRHTPLNIPGGMARSTVSWIKSALYGSGSITSFGIRQIGAIWFLLAMFFGSLFLNLIIDKKGRFIYAAVPMILAYIITPYFWAPLSLFSALAACFFMLIGVKMREIGIDKILRWPTVLGAFCAWLGIFLINLQSPRMFSIVRLSTSNLLLDIIAAIAATICVLALSRFIDKYLHRLGNFVKPFGEYSLYVLCFHLIDLIFIDWFAIFNLLGISRFHAVLRVLGRIFWCVCWVLIIRFLKYRKTISSEK